MYAAHLFQFSIIMKTVLFLALMALIAPVMSNMGRDHCSAGPNFPYGCGTFWWFVVILIGIACLVVFDIRKVAKREKK
jgi:hypothetical protein